VNLSELEPTKDVSEPKSGVFDLGESLS
jgi:hypothetical protein